MHITMFQDFNVLHYAVGQKYDSHYDAYNFAEYGPQPSQRVCIAYMKHTFPPVTCWYLGAHIMES